MSLPIAVNIDGGEGGRIAQSAEQKELDFGERGRYLIDTLSKRRNGISSSYPDLLDPSFGSCLRGESSKEGKKNGGRTLYHFQIKSSSKSDRKLFIYAQIIEFDSIFA